MMSNNPRKQKSDGSSSISRQAFKSTYDSGGVSQSRTRRPEHTNLGPENATPPGRSGTLSTPSSSSTWAGRYFRVVLPPEKADKRLSASPFFVAFFSLMKFLLPIQVMLVIPFLIYSVLYKYEIDVSPYVYIAVVTVLGITAYLVAVESLFALREDTLPAEPAIPYPPATAIIAAYLPNEVDIIIETLEAMFRVKYPAPLQVILAYNTPVALQMEEMLQKIARLNARFVLIHVVNSTSKAQNVNAALPYAVGTFTGIFDADHHPEPDVFTRAWRRLSQGYDVVQGHCVIRNGSYNWVTRLAAVDFEIIYGLSHMGRTRLHGFGVFGGSNGYWKTDVLRKIGMDRMMMTEDIDSSIRALRRGYTCVYDSRLISRELAPETFRAFWNQRMRWAQGWFQVSLKHFFPVLFSRYVNGRQKAGLFNLFIWRESYVWLSLQVVPILAFQLSLGRLRWFSPLFFLTSIFVFCIGPFQTLLAYAVADHEVKKHRSWFVSYALLSLFFFVELKNHIGRIAHMREVFGEHEWKVTPRSPKRYTSDRDVHKKI